MHIGLIGGIGPAATVLYYRGLVAAHAALGARMELTIVQAHARDLVDNFLAGRADEQAEIFRALIARLKAAGAEAAAVSSLAGHFCIGELRAVSPLPLIDAVPELEADLVRRGLTRVGVLGTDRVMESGVYGGLPSVRCIAPEGAELGRVHDAYVEMALAGAATDAHRELFFAAGRRLREERGAEAVVLAGTDLFLAFEGHDPGFPVIDAAEVLIAALTRASTGGR